MLKAHGSNAAWRTTRTLDPLMKKIHWRTRKRIIEEHEKKTRLKIFVGAGSVMFDQSIYELRLLNRMITGRDDLQIDWSGQIMVKELSPKTPSPGQASPKPGSV